MGRDRQCEADGRRRGRGLTVMWRTRAVLCAGRGSQRAEGGGCRVVGVGATGGREEGSGGCAVRWDAMAGVLAASGQAKEQAQTGPAAATTMATTMTTTTGRVQKRDAEAARTWALAGAVIARLPVPQLCLAGRRLTPGWCPPLQARWPGALGSPRLLVSAGQAGSPFAATIGVTRPGALPSPSHTPPTPTHPPRRPQGPGQAL